jgi:hypothetical protein
MSNQDNGGPAFPLNELNQTTGDICAQHFGVTVRDYMAAKAMQGLCATLTGAGTPKWDLLAIEAYEMADAMLAARGQQ